MYQYVFTKRGLQEIKKLPKHIQLRIIQKLDFCIASPQPLSHAEPLSGKELGDYRIRIGDYRVIFDIEEKTLVVLRVGHRREIYK